MRSFKIRKWLLWGGLVCTVGVLGVGGSAYLWLRSEPAQASSEQLKVFQAYLYEVPVLEKPLPVVCDSPQNWAVGTASLSISSIPEGASSLKGEMKRASWIQRRVFASFLVRNLRPQVLDTARLASFGAGGSPQSSSPVRNSSESVARLSQVGFSDNYDEAMLYADIKCGALSGSEFAYFARDVKHGNHWYVVRSDRR